MLSVSATRVSLLPRLASSVLLPVAATLLPAELFDGVVVSTLGTVVPGDKWVVAVVLVLVVVTGVVTAVVVVEGTVAAAVVVVTVVVVGLVVVVVSFVVVVVVVGVVEDALVSWVVGAVGGTTATVAVSASCGSSVRLLRWVGSDTCRDEVPTQS